VQIHFFYSITFFTTNQFNKKIRHLLTIQTQIIILVIILIIIKQIIIFFIKILFLKFTSKALYPSHNSELLSGNKIKFYIFNNHLI